MPVLGEAPEEGREISGLGLFGVRWKNDRVVQVRSSIALARGRSLRGSHRARAWFGLGSGAVKGELTPSLEIDARLDHGDAGRLLLPADAGDLDSEVMGRIWLGGRGAQLGRNALLLPIVYRLRDVERAGGGLGMHELSSGLGLRHMDRYQTDGWIELVGASYGRMTSRRSGGGSGFRPAPRSEELDEIERLDLRVGNVQDVVLVDDFDMVAVHSVGLAYTWLRDASGARQADLVTGRIATAVRIWNHGIVGFALARDARVADLGRRFVAEWRGELHGELAPLGGSMGGALDFATSRVADLTADEPSPASWRHAARVAWYLAPSRDMRVGVDVTSAYDNGVWQHQLGLFASWTVLVPPRGPLR